VGSEIHVTGAGLVLSTYVGLSIWLVEVGALLCNKRSVASFWPPTLYKTIKLSQR